MSIRIRVVDGNTIAICAARSVPKEGDLYLDDAAHHALTVKFSADFASMGFSEAFYLDPISARLIEQEESNNPNREWWDSEYVSRIED